jgi:uncharacterized PurR-regulated membrane protein YhhQ (DUF165 family)
MSPSEILAVAQQPMIAYPIIALTVGSFFFAGKRWTALYVAMMPLINWAFAAISTYPLPDWIGGGEFHPFTIVTGLVLVVRDFAQREVKHWIFLAMIAGLALSTLTAWPVIVLASGVAFLISETADWAIYTFSNKPLSQRIMLSSLVGAPLDQLVFLGLASLVVPGIFVLGSVLTGIASKLLGAWIVSQFVAARERQAAPISVNPV